MWMSTHPICSVRKPLHLSSHVASCATQIQTWELVLTVASAFIYGSGVANLVLPIYTYLGVPLPSMEALSRGRRQCSCRRASYDEHGDHDDIKGFVR